jgi:hypothetical protein
MATNEELIRWARRAAGEHQLAGNASLANLLTEVTDALEVADSRLWMVEDIVLGLDYAHDHARVQALTLLFDNED